ncbi:hypothetical protein MKW98_012054 [Papaver atlanticum]|uniref:mRNA (guanine-N(7))-methyltransferase n=1 Tax=Papaver atlanticum TaxID=357466 RepID=A0AAD4SMN7_9MAGN|nr:hypothetical protein MKW98_012054 [Papaver atlanticum]
MKRAYESASTSNAPCHSNQRIDPNGVSPYKREDENTGYMAQRVADHYSARSNQTFKEREASPIIHLKKLDNWIKSAGIGYYVGIDIAEGSIEYCRKRYNGDANHHQSRNRFTFPARLLLLRDDGPFNICSCQFAMHYSWSTEARARRALANVSALLRPGGTFIGTMPDANVIIKKLREAEGPTFGNSIYWIRFDEEYDHKRFRSSTSFGIKYEFHLEDAVDCPEWIVPFPAFKSLAEEYDLELVFVKIFHEFVDQYLKKPEFAELMRRFGILGDGNQDTSTLSSDEWEVAYLYTAFVSKKRGESDPKRQRTNRGPTNISKDDIMYT